MFTTATFFQSLLMLSSSPALHELQLKHRLSGLLLHAAQSGFGEVEVFDGVQLIGPTYSNPQSSAGLQHPDCKIVQYSSSLNVVPPYYTIYIKPLN